jgi:hypothetical protein
MNAKIAVLSYNTIPLHKLKPITILHSDASQAMRQSS